MSTSGISITRNDSAIVIVDNDVTENKTPGFYDYSASSDPADGLVATLKAQRNNIIYTSTNTSLYMVSENNINRFLLPIHTAYSGHLRVSISADDFWHTICSMLWIAVNGNPERYRSILVPDIGGVVVKSVNGELNSTSAFDTTLRSFEALILSSVGTNRYNTSMNNFNTTGAVEQRCSVVGMMKLFDDYYNYRVVTNCGIKQIQLRGTVEDYQRVLYRIKESDKFDLGWWKKELVYVLEKIIAAYNGAVDTDFWRNMYVTDAGTSNVHGWINVLFPYKINIAGGYIIDELSYTWKNAIELGQPGLSLDLFPTCIQTVDVVHNNLGIDTTKKFIGGHLTACCNDMSLPITLTTSLGYAVL